MAKVKNFSVKLDEDQVAALERNAAEGSTDSDSLLNSIVAEWLDRHGTAEVYSPKGTRLWSEEDQKAAATDTK